MAMVCALDHALSEHDLDHFSSGAHVARDRGNERGDGGWFGRDHLDRQRSGPIPVGVGV